MHCNIPFCFQHFICSKKLARPFYFLSKRMISDSMFQSKLYILQWFTLIMPYFTSSLVLYKLDNRIRWPSTSSPPPLPSSFQSTCFFFFFFFTLVSNRLMHNTRTPTFFFFLKCYRNSSEPVYSYATVRRRGGGGGQSRILLHPSHVEDWPSIIYLVW